MTDSTLVFVNEAEDGIDVVVNFGVFAARDATPAEIDRLAETLLPDVEPLEIVCEHRYEFDREREASVYQVKVRLRPEDGDLVGPVVEEVEAWARDCIAERRLLRP